MAKTKPRYPKQAIVIAGSLVLLAIIAAVIITNRQDPYTAAQTKAHKKFGGKDCGDNEKCFYKAYRNNCQAARYVSEGSGVEGGYETRIVITEKSKDGSCHLNFDDTWTGDIYGPGYHYVQVCTGGIKVKIGEDKNTYYEIPQCSGTPKDAPVVQGL